MGPDVPVTHHRVRPRDTLWSIAAERLDSAKRWRELAAANYGVVQADGGSLTTSHWIEPGWLLELPTESRIDVVTSVPISAPTSAPTGTPRTPPRPPAPPIAPVAPLGAGIVGVGVADLVDRMRRVQQRHRSTGTLIRLPDRARVAVERRLRIGDGRDVVVDVERTFEMLGDRWRGASIEPPVVLGVRVTPDAVDVLAKGSLSGDQVVEPFATVDARTLRIAREALSTPRRRLREVRCTTFPAPTLVTVGASEGARLLVHLEAMGSLALRGPVELSDPVLRAIALELATSVWADEFELVLVGFGSELTRFDRVRTASADQVAHELALRRVRGIAALEHRGARSYAEARWLDDSSRWQPVVVLCGPSVATNEVTDLFQTGGDPRVGVVVVAVGEDFDGEHLIELGADGPSASLADLGAIVLPQRIEVDELRDVEALLDTAADVEPVSRFDDCYAELPVPIPADGACPASGGTTSVAFETRRGEGVRAAAPTDSPEADAAPVLEAEGGIEVEVKVLGPVEITGAARAFTRAWAKELVVYLAMHPNGAVNDSWATALWPDRLMAASSLHSTASVARRALGHASDGRDHLPRSHGRLALAPSVGTDWGRFVAAADTSTPAGWRMALELVRGRLFEGLRADDWPILEGIGPAIEASVVDVAAQLAAVCLEANDPAGAEWAARKGLLVSPYDERLYRVLLRAADLGGNPAGVESVMAELLRVVADEVEPLESVHPSTVELYRSLSRRGAPAGSSKSV